jgi:alpha-tubulin suppressor-like RCC1 family protein
MRSLLAAALGAVACGVEDRGQPEGASPLPSGGSTSGAGGADNAAGAAGDGGDAADAGDAGFGGETTTAGSGGMAGSAGATAVAGSSGSAGSAGSASTERPKTVHIAMTEDHACAVSSDGRVQCWGDNFYGQLGLGDTTGTLEWVGDDETPASVGDAKIGGFAKQVATGMQGTCVLYDTGGVRCWGSYPGPRDRQGVESIGDDETPDSVPEVAFGGVATQIIAAGVHACALMEGGAVRCWGLSDIGALGYGNTAVGENSWIGDDEAPALAGDVPVGGKVIQLSSTGGHVCALLETNTVRCWGGGDAGKLGYQSTENVGDDETPASMGDIDVGGPVKQVAAGGSHSCVLFLDGTVRCWGARVPTGWGVEPIGDNEPPSTAPLIDLGGKAIYIAAGSLRTCAILEGGWVRCWGEGVYVASGYGKLGTIGDDETPAEAGDIPVGGPAVQIECAGQYMCVLLENGDVRCWGGDATKIPYPALDQPPLGVPFVPIIGDNEYPDYYPPIELFTAPPLP